MPSWVRRWTGSAWQNCNLYRWDGSAWKVCDLYRWSGSAWVLIEGLLYLIKAGVVDTAVMGSMANNTGSLGNITSVAAAYNSGGYLRLSFIPYNSDGSMGRWNYNKLVPTSKYKTMKHTYMSEEGKATRYTVWLCSSIGNATAVAQMPVPQDNEVAGTAYTRSLDISSISADLYIALWAGTASAGHTGVRRVYELTMS
jgi:hypothetical protein